MLYHNESLRHKTHNELYHTLSIYQTPVRIYIDHGEQVVSPWQHYYGAPVLEDVVISVDEVVLRCRSTVSQSQVCSRHSRYTPGTSHARYFIHS